VWSFIVAVANVLGEIFYAVFWCMMLVGAPALMGVSLLFLYERLKSGEIRINDSEGRIIRKSDEPLKYYLRLAPYVMLFVWMAIVIKNQWTGILENL
jgi:hypothetical protein